MNKKTEKQFLLNKYYWNPDMRLVSCCTGTELYNDSLLEFNALKESQR